MSALLQSRVSHLHKVNLLKGSAARAWEPSSHPQSVRPEADPVNSGEQEDHSWPSENGVSDPKHAPRRKAAESVWELLLVCKPLPWPVLSEALLPTPPRPLP